MLGIFGLEREQKEKAMLSSLVSEKEEIEEEEEEVQLEKGVFLTLQVFLF